MTTAASPRVTLRVANVLPYAVLKVFAFQDRHENKDAYDLIFTLLNCEGGPRAAGRTAGSPVARQPQVAEAIALLGERFRDVGQDGPSAYASFLATPGDDDERARLRQEAVATAPAPSSPDSAHNTTDCLAEAPAYSNPQLRVSH